jgi:hypothetical protein
MSVSHGKKKIVLGVQFWSRPKALWAFYQPSTGYDLDLIIYIFNLKQISI